MGQQMAHCDWEWVKPVNQLQRENDAGLNDAAQCAALAGMEVLHYAAVSLLTSIRPSAAAPAGGSLINEKTTTGVSILFL